MTTFADLPIGSIFRREGFDKEKLRKVSNTHCRCLEFDRDQIGKRCLYFTSKKEFREINRLDLPVTRLPDEPNEFLETPSSMTIESTNRAFWQDFIDWIDKYPDGRGSVLTLHPMVVKLPCKVKNGNS